MTCSTHTRSDIGLSYGRRIRASKVKTDWSHGVCVQAVERLEKNGLTRLCMATGQGDEMGTCGWISRWLWNLHWLTLTEFRKELLSSWPRGKADTRACSKLCVACAASCADGLSWCIIHGCLLSVLLQHLLMNTWARSVKAGTDTAMPEVYADAGVFSKVSEDIDVANQGTFCQSHTAKTECRKQGMRLAEWSRAGNRRRDMSGKESTASIDKIATIKALSSTMINFASFSTVASGHTKDFF